MKPCFMYIWYCLNRVQFVFVFLFVCLFSVGGLDGNGMQLDFGRSGVSTCPPLPGGVDPTLPPWPRIEIPAGTTTFKAEIGEAGGARGYEGITGEM